MSRFPFDRRHWIFDLDGTLTVAVHDFAAIREALGLPAGRPILEAIDELDPAVAGPLRVRLDEIEAELVRRTEAAAGAATLCRRLSESGHRLGILTRNSVGNAMATLAAAGLARWFVADDVVGRDEATPKPSPEGIHRLLRRWEADPADTVIVGDYLFDLLAGRAAGVGTVYVDVDAAFPFREHADLTVAGIVDLVSRMDAATSRFAPNLRLGLESPPMPEGDDLDQMLAASEEYAGAFDAGGLAAPPARRAVVVTCMDARVRPEAFLGLEPGDAHVLRNAGGRVTDDVLRSLVLSTHLLGTREVLVIHHTDCGSASRTQEEIVAEVTSVSGADAGDLDFLTIVDADAALAEDVDRVLHCRWLPPGVRVSGYRFDVRTGVLEQLVAPLAAG